MPIVVHEPESVVLSKYKEKQINKPNTAGSGSDCEIYVTGVQVACVSVFFLPQHENYIALLQSSRCPASMRLSGKQDRRRFMLRNPATIFFGLVDNLPVVAVLLNWESMLCVPPQVTAVARGVVAFLFIQIIGEGVFRLLDCVSGSFSRD